MEREKFVNEMMQKYCGNNMSGLKRISYPLITRFGGINEMDYDDFYSYANEVVWNAANSFDIGTSVTTFENYLIGCILKKFKSLMTMRNRQKRVPRELICSIDMQLSPDSDKTFADIIESDFDLFKEVEKLSNRDGIDVMMGNLSKKQKSIVELLVLGYKKEDILLILNIDDRRYDTCMERLRTHENRLILTKQYDDLDEIERKRNRREKAKQLGFVLVTTE